MKQISKIILFLVFFIESVSLAALAQLPKNAMCPVTAGEHAREKFFVDYQGERIYFCCRNCVKAFKRNPEKFLKNLNQHQHTVNEKEPS